MRPRLLRARAPTKALLLVVLLLGVAVLLLARRVAEPRARARRLGVVLSLRGGRPPGRSRCRGDRLVGAPSSPARWSRTGSADFLAERARPQTYDTERFSGQRAGLQPAEEYPLGAGPGQFESIAGISAHSTYARAHRRAGLPGRASTLARAARLHARRSAVAQRGGRAATPTASARRRCSPPGAACSPTARSSTRCTGATCGSWRG